MRPSSARLPRTIAGVAAAVLALVACSGGTPSSEGTDAPTGSETATTQLVAHNASFDLAVGEDQRLLIGLLRSDNTLVGGGEVQVRLGYLGTADDPVEGEVELSEPATADFLPLPGDAPDVGDAPTFIEGTGAGVYQAAVDLDTAGLWGAQVTATVDGQTLTATTRFEVAEAHTVPTVGDPAPAVANPTVDSPDAVPATIDSRARDGAEVPDPGLHDAVVADLLEAGRPMVVVVSTPVYCQSQFCGPITDAVADLATEYEDRAEFVHLEVWENFEELALNPWVAEWIADPETGAGNEPWTFLVGADGTIRARWANVLDEAELRSMLDELPAG